MVALAEVAGISNCLMLSVVACALRAANHVCIRLAIHNAALGRERCVLLA